MQKLAKTIFPMHSELVFKVALRGDTLLTSPRWNKGTAFTKEERNDFGLTGRLPFRVNTIEEQCERAYDQLCSRESPIQKNLFLQSLKEQNWVLYYSLLSRHLKELTSIIYTPTEAEAIENYSHLFRRSEGLFLTFPNQDSMEEDFLEQTRGKDIELIVCTDAEAILGIGDQGVGGIGISSAKSAIYTLLAGINPAKALSVTLDVGTDNEKLLNDHLYVGWPSRRVRSDEYDRFIDKFVQLIRKHHPHCLLHFEDFGVTNAQRLLELYRNEHSVFNDDIQGTGAVTLAALMAAIGVTKSKLADQRYVIFGAGSAGLGIAKQVRDAIILTDGVSREEANKKFYLIDRFGLIKQSLGPNKIRPALQEFVRPDEEWSDIATNDTGEVELLEAVRKVRPTVLIGCSTKGGAFTERVVRTMKEGCERPIIFPLSNPSNLVEVNPKDANDWTEGMALLATGSPFPPAKMPNGKDYIIAECNNALIYPGLGFGSMLSQSRQMTDGMIIAGARRLAALSPALKDPDSGLLPDFQDAPAANFEVAIAVAEHAFDEGIQGVSWSRDEVRIKAEDKQWKPVYGRYEYDEQGAR
jgi:malate dehydrogenase (oxaloacetate-decarboxylating)